MKCGRDIQQNSTQPETKHEIRPLAGTWMGLESAILSEVSQRKVSIIQYSLSVESKTYSTNELIYKSEIESQKTHLQLLRG